MVFTDSASTHSRTPLPDFRRPMLSTTPCRRLAGTRLRSQLVELSTMQTSGLGCLSSKHNTSMRDKSSWEFMRTRAATPTERSLKPRPLKLPLRQRTLMPFRR